MNQEQVLEKQDQLKATIITLVITVILFSLFFYVRYQQPVIQVPTGGEGIEVNLGDAETGYGAIPPTSIGAASQEQTNTSTNTNPSLLQKCTYDFEGALVCVQCVSGVSGKLPERRKL